MVELLNPCINWQQLFNKWAHCQLLSCTDMKRKISGRTNVRIRHVRIRHDRGFLFRMISEQIWIFKTILRNEIIIYSSSHFANRLYSRAFLVFVLETHLSQKKEFLRIKYIFVNIISNLFSWRKQQYLLASLWPSTPTGRLCKKAIRRSCCRPFVAGNWNF